MRIVGTRLVLPSSKEGRYGANNTSVGAFVISDTDVGRRAYLTLLSPPIHLHRKHIRVMELLMAHGSCKVAQ